jgi:hypothetical protein
VFIFQFPIRDSTSEHCWNNQEDVTKQQQGGKDKDASTNNRSQDEETPKEATSSSSTKSDSVSYQSPNNPIGVQKWSQSHNVILLTLT